MVSRNLTEVFILMRNNAIHSKQLFSEPVSHDYEHLQLMRGEENDMEMGTRRQPAPPPWLDALEESHYIITRLRTKLSELQDCHEQQISRPALDDSSHQQRIDRLTSDIGRQFSHAQTQLNAIKSQIRHGSKTQQKIGQNVVAALVTTLQELSISYRTAQSNYLKTITSREQRSNAFFDLPNFEELSLDNEAELLPGLTGPDLFLPSSSQTYQNEISQSEDLDRMFDRPSLNLQQLQLMQEDNTKMVEEREQEVNKIVRSIVDLNDIFKELGHMVHEQGTVLDRIDYNIEQTQTQVHEGYKQLQKAERYQRKNRKMHCILVLGITVIIMFFLLIIVKS